MMSKLFFAVLFAAGFSAKAADQKIALVDLQKAVQATAQGKKAKTELETELEKKKKELQKKDADLKKMNEDLEKKKSVLSEEALSKKQAEFQEEMVKFRDVVGKSQMEIQKRERELTQPILDKMRKIIEKVGKEKGYTLILESGPFVLYADKAQDITDDVIKAFEKNK